MPFRRGDLAGGNGMNADRLAYQSRLQNLEGHENRVPLLAR